MRLFFHAAVFCLLLIASPVLLRASEPPTSALSAGENPSIQINDDANSAKRIADLRRAAGKGNPEAMTNLAMLELSGTGIPKNVEAGLALLQRAAGTGYERAEYMLGLSLATDMLDRAPDKEKAKYWLRKAAGQGDKKAQSVLAQMDQAGSSESIDTLRSRAGKGDKAAQYDLGSRYSQGLGVDQNHAEAMKWLRLAAGQNYPLAQFELAGLYMDGKVVPKDLDKARYWLKKAAAAGDSRARKMLVQIGNP